MTVRPARAADVALLAAIWHESWHDTHAHLLPAELIQFRTLESFRNRLRAALPHVRVVGPAGSPLGFCIVKGDELDQLFVSAQARGTGVAAALTADAERLLAGRGVRTAWLACAIGNDRAARFYEKCGWRRVGTMTHNAETSQGVFPLEAWRFEKDLTR
jgi:GNAT superfamily N-acetyltransferase